MYQLAAVVAEAALLRERVTGSRHGVVAELRHGMALVPAGDALREELTGAAGTGDAAWERVLAGWSAHGPLAFVRAGFFGGDGEQSAEVWRDGKLAWGPVVDDRFDGPREGWPINAALARLGVRPSGRTYAHDPGRALDLFDEVGLGMERDVADWVAYARAGRTPAHVEAPARAARRREEERALAEITPDLDGREIMALLGIPPGPLVGAATRRLRQVRAARGPLSRAEAEAALRAWAHAQGLGQ
ncbi:hypothetical protein [Catenuloplanes indicus]|uniref:Uncharacterized protein n=1 Tax=Catenuloplanes indicus TaxID=137267 RepID=A0AAE4B4J9_9ACTN|nr:hypothetical protein [Catenuloplanes indicus]MDQ0371523.1 hypothetical protein [Catenuloplanes indicus]